MVQGAQKVKWTGTLLHLYSLTGNSHRAHQQISTGIRAQLVAYINFAGCLHSCPYIYDKRETGKMEKAPKKHPTVPSHKPHGS